MSNVNKFWVDDVPPYINVPKGGIQQADTAIKHRVAKKKPTFQVDVVHATPDKVLDSARCILCKKAYKKTDAVIRNRNLTQVATPDQTMHRRCMEDLLSSSVDDVPKENVKFERYRQQVADKHGIEV